MSSFGLVVCFSASALGQAGAPTQRVHIPGIPDGTSIYPKSLDRGDNFVSIGCVAKSPNGEFLIADWRGAERPPIAGAPAFAARAPLVFRLQGDREMLNFQVGHEVQITGPIVEKADASRPPGMKVGSILYLSRTCWRRGTTTEEAAKPRP
ncbi:MAG TPA: hypothetical protein VGN55_06085 [Xanthobacteraceae bacterium]